MSDSCFLGANPHLKIATGEADTGVIVSWHTEGPKNVEQNASTPALLPGGININPLWGGMGGKRV